MEAELQTERGRKKTADGGFLYNYHKLNADRDKKFWRCDKINEGCKGRIHTTINDAVIYRSGNHNHGSNAAAVEVVKVKTAMKRRAQETMEQPAQIINNVIQGIDQATMGLMPNKDANRKTIQRARNQITHAPPNPINLAELIIPDQYKFYEPFPGQQELFLLRDTGRDDPNRILLFGRESHRLWSHQMEEIFLDGTFSLSPPLFEQVYAVLAKRGDYVFPVLYALLRNKQQPTYGRLFGLIKEVLPRFNPSFISLDYEIAVINSIRNQFPDAVLRGCLYHLMKNFRRHIGVAGLMQRYDNDALFSLHARMIIALAFVPTNDLENAFEVLSQEIPEELQPILDWLEDNYGSRLLGRESLGRRNLSRRH